MGRIGSYYGHLTVFHTRIHKFTYGVNGPTTHIKRRNLRVLPHNYITWKNWISDKKLLKKKLEYVINFINKFSDEWIGDRFRLPQEGSSVDELKDIKELQEKCPKFKLWKLTFPHTHQHLFIKKETDFIFSSLNLVRNSFISI